MTVRSPSSGPPAARRFRCAESAEVARGRRRIAWLLLGPAVVAAGAAAWAFSQGRWGAGAVAGAAVLLCWTAWRMSRDLDPVELEVAPGWLVVRLRRRRIEVELDGGTARRLTAEEAEHLARLAHRGPASVASGAYDSSLLGEVEVYAGDLDRGVLVEARDGRLVVSPERPDELVAGLLDSSLHA